jgi:hypothetical protein
MMKYVAALLNRLCTSHFILTSPARHWHLDLTEAEPLQLKCAGRSDVEGMEMCYAQDLVEALADSFE